MQVSTYDMSPANIAHVGLAWASDMQALVLIGNAKQAMSVGKRKSGPVETGLTGPVATALVLPSLISRPSPSPVFDPFQ